MFHVTQTAGREPRVMSRKPRFFKHIDTRSTYYALEDSQSNGLHESVRVCICYSFHGSMLWHVPITVERASDNALICSATHLVPQIGTPRSIFGRKITQYF